MPTVNTPLGLIEGYVGLTVNSKPFLKFEGIPYAKPPIGDLRFEVSFHKTKNSITDDTLIGSSRSRAMDWNLES